MKTSATVQRQYELTIMHLQRQIRKALHGGDFALMERLSAFLEGQMSSYTDLLKILPPPAELPEKEPVTEPLTETADEPAPQIVEDEASTSILRPARQPRQPAPGLVLHDIEVDEPVFRREIESAMVAV